MYRAVSASGVRQRIVTAEREFARLSQQGAHNRDRTGAQGENLPLWYDLMAEFIQWKEANTGNNRARAHRAQHRNTQQVLQVEQAPLGPGNPTLRSEVAAENPPTLGGNNDIGAGLVVRETNDDGSIQQNDSNHDSTGEAVNAPTRRRRNRTVSHSNEEDGPGVISRNNTRRRVSEVQEEMVTHRETMRDHVVALRDIARAMQAPPVIAATTGILQPNAVQDATIIAAQMERIAGNIGDPQTLQFAHQQNFLMMHGLMGRFNAANGIVMPAVTLPAAVTGPVGNTTTNNNNNNTHVLSPTQEGTY